MQLDFKTQQARIDFELTPWYTVWTTTPDRVCIAVMRRLRDWDGPIDLPTMFKAVIMGVEFKRSQI